MAAKSLIELKAERDSNRDKQIALRNEARALQEKYTADNQAISQKLQELGRLELELTGRIKQEEDRAKD